MPTKQKILIVDDFPANIQVLNQILAADYEIFFATSGQDALAMAGKQNPDLVLLDVMMPGMDGYTVARCLKEDPATRDIPIIFVTALDELEDETRGLELGAIDYITKPVRPPIVRARVHNHLELKRQRDLLSNLSAVDGLTGIANRRRLDSFLEQEWRRAVRAAQPLSAILMDIDCFKGYNDGYGHLAGDECLRAVAGAIAGAALRPTDLAARYGGEEFICVLPETDLEGALQVAERIRDAVTALALPHPSSPASPHVTLSFGVATCRPMGEMEKTELVDHADRLLYRAKERGRDRIEGEMLEPALEE